MFGREPTTREKSNVTKGERRVGGVHYTRRFSLEPVEQSGGIGMLGGGEKSPAGRHKHESKVKPKRKNEERTER